jgi:hypothetical protein
MHAEHRADERLQVLGSAESRQIHQPLDAAISGPDDIDCHATDLVAVGALDGCE